MKTKHIYDELVDFLEELSFEFYEATHSCPSDEQKELYERASILLAKARGEA
jgi:hypothetical protein